MEKLEHPLWIVDVVNAVLGPPVKAALEALGFHIKAEHGIVIPNYLVMVMLIVAVLDRAVAHHPLASERREPGQAADRVRGWPDRRC